MSEVISLNLQVWKQSSNEDVGSFEFYSVKDISIHISFLEMLDVVNENLQKEGMEFLYDYCQKFAGEKLSSQLCF